MTFNPKLRTMFDLLLLFTVLTIADFVITKMLIDIHGFGVEYNPIMYKLIVATDTAWSILWVKLVTVLVAWLFFWRTVYTVTVCRALLVLIVLHAFVVGKGYEMLISSYGLM